jgi:hypothetical protein
MGFADYFRNRATATSASQDVEKSVTPAQADFNLPITNASSSSAVISSSSSAIVDDVKHEVMASYLYQQQSAQQWVGQQQVTIPYGAPSMSEEGVLLRKSRGNYIACPPTLARGVFADACAALNVQV